MFVRIKVPVRYTYKEYPFCPEATAYSRKLARRKAEKRGILFAVLGCLAMMVAFIAFMKVYPESNEGFVLFAIVLGIWAGLDANRMINKWYEMRIEQELKRALQENGLNTSNVQL
ncbi:MAG TPA: hypothetical protein IAB02_00015 [Candidatus Pullichristensenella excrementigallinarum]|uniref:Uncharacterized protein n=1 Tax=Candidatus Pullichristensenella excrementigallinarum TaxID=2840907 RepID=A0A9D1IBS6_9FIRM|nr:hypothetical protein [Candidatus Pullichristensenella excrementigallinarum]